LMVVDVCASTGMPYAAKALGAGRKRAPASAVMVRTFQPVPWNASHRLMTANPSIERTCSSKPRLLPHAAPVKR